jgi:hypothetical protein
MLAFLHSDFVFVFVCLLLLSHLLSHLLSFLDTPPFFPPRPSGLDLADPANYLASTNVLSVADEQGWRVNASPFTGAGSSSDPGHPASEGLLDFTATYGSQLDYSNGFPKSIL